MARIEDHELERHPDDPIAPKGPPIMPAADAGTKPSNPKDIIGGDKLPLHLWPVLATAQGALALLDGALKYGRSNFREVGVRPSIYVDAAKRHLDDWFEGNDFDKDSGIPNLGHALACIAILIDAEAVGEINDDRNYKGRFYRDAFAKLTTHVRRIKEMHKGRTPPKHFTIGDDA